MRTILLNRLIVITIYFCIKSYWSNWLAPFYFNNYCRHLKVAVMFTLKVPIGLLGKALHYMRYENSRETIKLHIIILTTLMGTLTINTY